MASVELSGVAVMEDLYVLSIDYRANTNPALLRKVLICNSVLHFSPPLKSVTEDIKLGAKRLNVRYSIGEF
jgi:hypothetical protein